VPARVCTRPCVNVCVCLRVYVVGPACRPMPHFDTHAHKHIPHTHTSDREKSCVESPCSLVFVCLCVRAPVRVFVRMISLIPRRQRSRHHEEAPSKCPLRSKRPLRSQPAKRPDHPYLPMTHLNPKPSTLHHHPSIPTHTHTHTHTHTTPHTPHFVGFSPISQGC